MCEVGGRWVGSNKVVELKKKKKTTKQNPEPWDFPGSLLVKISLSNAGGTSSILGWGAKIPHASQPKKQNMKQAIF